MAQPPLLSLAGIRLTFGGDPLLQGADIAIAPRERIALVGRNGSGKSTLLKIAAGLIEADSGERFIDPGATVAYLPQEPDFGGAKTVGAYVASGLGPMSDPYAVERLIEELGLAPDMATRSLSGGEAQRIRLATQIGSGLTGVLYVLDEPSIGLHQRDNRRLIDTLTRLRDLGNTVLVVEHDEETIRESDWIVDIGPGAGEHGGQIVYSGPVPGLAGVTDSVTGDYISGRRSIPVPAERRSPGADRLVIRGAREHNLDDLTVEIPLGCFVAVTGVSGSGKSTLVRDILLPVLMQQIYKSKTPAGRHKRIDGIEHLDKVIDMDQSPIGRTPRSSPATYTGVFDHIRKLFAATNEAKMRGYLPGRFSFNVKGGRCDACSGDGGGCPDRGRVCAVYGPVAPL